MLNKWKKYLKHGLEIAAEASEILIHLRDKPKPQDYVAISLRLFNSYLHHSEKLKKRPFKGWNMVDLWEYKDSLYEIAKLNFETETLFEYDDGVKDVLIVINGVRFGWSDNGDRVHGPMIESSTSREECMEALGKMVWKHLDSPLCEIGKNKGTYDDSFTVFKVDRNENVHKSKVAEEILKRMEDFSSESYNRSILIHGIPGTGKSSAMRYVAKKFGNKSLRINVGDLDHLTSEDMLIAIELLKPQTVLIDDFDRTTNPTKFLTELEDINNNVKLLMVSVNHLEKLEEAVVRPGRFDDLIEISKLDDEIVDELIGDDVPDSVRDRLRKLPIAYVVEFHKRRKVLGTEKAINEIIDLESRISSVRLRIAGEILESSMKRKRKRKRRTKKRPEEKGVEFNIKVGEEP